MIIKGSLGYDQYGRKRKKTSKRRSSSGLGHHSFTVATRDHAPHASPVLEQARLHREKYPSLMEQQMKSGTYKADGDGMRKKEPMKYTGDLIQGIATMHKSNAVPVMKGTDQAKDIARMRRG